MFVFMYECLCACMHVYVCARVCVSPALFCYFLFERERVWVFERRDAYIAVMRLVESVDDTITCQKIVLAELLKPLEVGQTTYCYSTLLVCASSMDVLQCTAVTEAQIASYALSSSLLIGVPTP